MDTNSNIKVKQILSIFLDGLSDTGYGPKGILTREKWRNECLVNFQAGKDLFRIWQERLRFDIIETLPDVSFGVKTVYDDGTTSEALTESFQTKPPYCLDFVGHVFLEGESCASYEFLRNVLFSSATFKADAFFKGARFSEEADFTITKFFGWTSFHTAKFDGDADFSGATFSSWTFFDSTIFNADTYFRRATFAKSASFFKVKFNNQCGFQFSIFESSANFENADIQNVGHFENAKFHGEIPNFLGVDNAKTLLVFSQDDCFNNKDVTSSATNRIAQLKRLADEQGQTDQALMFNKFELNAKRAQARIKAKPLNWLQKLSNSDFWFANATVLYDKLSDYGRSFTRPLTAYLALLIATLWLAVVNTIIFSAKNCESEQWYLFTNLWREQIECLDKTKAGETKIPLSGWRAAFEYTSYRASGVLDFVDADKQTIAVANRLFDQSIEPWWMRIWGVFKAIASTALLFLAALGLRNKYRIK